MDTHCTPEQLHFHPHGRREVIARFDGGRITSDAGGVLLRETDLRLGLMERLARCFRDGRKPGSVEHPVRSLAAQRVYALALGYEDLNDHEDLRRDRLLALLVGQGDLTGAGRVRLRDRGCPLAASSTLNRLELGGAEAATDRYKRIAADFEAMDRLLVDVFVESYAEPPEEIWLDLDATDDPLHGRQEGRFFHGYYGRYCYLPLYVFCGAHLLCARLRRSNIDASAGSEEELARVVAQVRRRWPRTRVVVRGDSGFCREPLMRWCEENGVGYVFGMARNARLVRAIGRDLYRAEVVCRRTGAPVSRLPLSHEKELVQNPPGGGQGATPAQGGEPAVRGHQPPPPAGRRQAPLRRTLLRPGRDGEPHQGTATRPVRRPHQQRHPEGQSAAALLRLLRLRPDARTPAPGAGRHDVRQGPVRHDPAETAQDRRPRAGLRAQGPAVYLRGLAPCGALRKGSGQPAYAPALAGGRVEKPGVESKRHGLPQRETCACASAGTPRKPSKSTKKRRSGAVRHRIMPTKKAASRIKPSTTSYQAVPKTW